MGLVRQGDVSRHVKCYRAGVATTKGICARFNPRSVSRQAPLRRRARVVCVVVEGRCPAMADGVEVCDVGTRGVPGQ